MKIKFVHSEANIADPFTNNLSNRPFHLITSRYVHHEKIFENSLPLFQSHEIKALYVIEEGC